MTISKDTPQVQQMLFLFDGLGNLSDVVATIRIGILENSNPTLVAYTVQESLYGQLTTTQQSNLATVASRLRQLALANLDAPLPTPASPTPFSV